MVNLVSVGATDFAVDFLGTAGTIIIAGESCSLQQADTAWTLVSRKGRRLRQVTPVPGKIVAVNTDLLTDPGLLEQSPYDKGWIMCVKSHQMSASMRDLLSCEEYLIWLSRAVDDVSACLDPAGVDTLQKDVWPAAFGDHLSDTDWKELCDRLLPDTVSAEQLARRHG